MPSGKHFSQHRCCSVNWDCFRQAEKSLAMAVKGLDGNFAHPRPRLATLSLLSPPSSTSLPADCRGLQPLAAGDLHQRQGKLLVHQVHVCLDQISSGAPRSAFTAEKSLSSDRQTSHQKTPRDTPRSINSSSKSPALTCFSLCFAVRDFTASGPIHVQP